MRMTWWHHDPRAVTMSSASLIPEAQNLVLVPCKLLQPTFHSASPLVTPLRDFLLSRVFLVKPLRESSLVLIKSCSSLPGHPALPSSPLPLEGKAT